MNLAYVTVSFPSLSETFVLRETNSFKIDSGVKNFSVFAYRLPKQNWINTEHADWIERAIYLRKRVLFNFMAVLFFVFTCPVKATRLFVLYLHEFPKLPLIKALKTLVHILAGFGLAMEVKRSKIDRIHAHFATASTLSLVANILTGVPFSFTAHASGDIYVYSAFLQEKIKRACQIIAISQYNRKYLQLISDGNLVKSKTAVVYNGVEIPREPVEKNANDIPVIFMSAAFSGFKGHGTLVDALAIVAGNGRDFFCRLAGDGPYYHRIAASIEEAKLGGKIEMLGSLPLSKVYEQLSESDIFVFPSEININGIRDGMPTAITEAMAYGLPVVGTAVSGIAEQITDGYNGFIVPERDENALAAKIDILLQDEKLRREMGANSRIIALNKFDMERNIESLKGIILGKGMNGEPGNPELLDEKSTIHNGSGHTLQQGNVDPFGIEAKVGRV